MDFGETLLAAQRNQQQKSSDNAYYRTKYEPPKKEQKPASRLSANIQKFLAKKEEEEKRKQEEARKKRDELLAMRDPKATKKIQKMLKVIKSANKSVLEEAVDRDNTAVTRTGAEQPDQDDYGYESQEAAALYKKMMDKYSKLPDEEKFPASKGKVSKKDLEGTRERMRTALQREEEPQPRQRKSKLHHKIEREESPPPQPEKKVEKLKVRRPAPPPIDFNQLLKLAEQKKDEPVALVAPVKKPVEQEPERPMTKRQKKEFEEEQARREARKRRILEAEGKISGVSKPEKPRMEAEKKAENTFTRIPKIGDKNVPTNKTNKINPETTKRSDSDDRRRTEQDKYNSIKHKQEMQRSELKPKIELKSQNTYRIEKSSGDRPSKMSRESDRMKTNFKDDREKDRIVDRPKANKMDENRKVVRQDERGISNRDHERHDNRPKLSQPTKDERGINSRDHERHANRVKMSQPTDKSKINKEQDRSKISREDIRNKPIRPDDGSKPVRDENRPNGYSNVQNKLPMHKGEQSRKPAIKEKVITMEKKLFGNSSPKLNSSHRPEKYLKLDDNKSKDIPKTSKPLNEKRPTSTDSIKVKPKVESKTFDFDKHVNSLKKVPERNNVAGSSRKPGPGDVRRKILPGGDSRGRQPPPKRHFVDSESEYDSEMDDFIDDGEDDANYSTAIREIFGYDKRKYQHLDEEDDAAMESSFAQQMREEYISKRIGIMEDLEDMRMEAMEKKKSKKRRRISDDDD